MYIYPKSLFNGTVYPSSYKLNDPAVSESGSSETGHSNVSDCGRVCNAPYS